MPVMTGLSGNEMYCLARKGLQAGDLVVGNSVYSIGLLGGVGSAFQSFLGGEITPVTEVIHAGRESSYRRLVAEAERHGGIGIGGVSSELVLMGGNVEFLSIGSCLRGEGSAQGLEFSTSADGQELYCQLDAGFIPKKFVFGNVAYSVGFGGGLIGGLRSFARGEIPEYSNVFNQTRHLALQRLTEEARQAGANAVVGIRTSILPFRGMQEMVMLGTASHHTLLGERPPITSDLTNQEMWNLARMGYMPLQLVLGVSVYSLGIIGRVRAALRALGRGEIGDYTHLIYEARENAIDRLKRDAAAVGADDVAGIKTYVYDLGSGVMEFLAIGTAIKRMEGMRTASETLPCQAIIRDQDTFFNAISLASGSTLNRRDTSVNSARQVRSNAGMIVRFLLELFR